MKGQALHDRVRLTVSIHGTGGVHLDPRTPKQRATVTAIGEDGVTRVVRKERVGPLYGAWLAPGPYSLHAHLPLFSSPVMQTVYLKRPGTTVSFYLSGEAATEVATGLSSLRLNAANDLLAVAFCQRPPSRLALERLRRYLVRFSDVLEEVENESGQRGEQRTLLFRFKKKENRQELVDELTSRLKPWHVCMGVPLNLGQRNWPLSILTNRFRVRLRSEEWPDGWENDRTIYKRKDTSGVWICQFNGWDVHEQLNKLIKMRELISFVEPQILTHLSFAARQAQSRPRPKGSSHQVQLKALRVFDADDYLRTLEPPLNGGSPTICVASIDQGINRKDRCTRRRLSDGKPQIIDCYDFERLGKRGSREQRPSEPHGMQTFSVIAAHRDANRRTSGIAYNTRHLPIKYTHLFDGDQYPVMLVFAAGLPFKSPQKDPPWPKPPRQPADIINCSHHPQPGIPLSTAMDRALRNLSTYGRNGLGTLVVYAAGNQLEGKGEYITGYNVYAAHPRTISVSNTRISRRGQESLCRLPFANGADSNKRRSLLSGRASFGGPSNFGPEIDVCAPGENIFAIDHNGQEQPYGGTSAAAAIVSGSVALMLSVNPRLTWVDVRDIIRSTARRIDWGNQYPDGRWNKQKGFSRWYGYGSVNTEEAVKVAREFDTCATRLVIRHNLGDDGASPSLEEFYRSPDLWVRCEHPEREQLHDPSYDGSAPHQDPRRGQTNYMRVRVKNFGSRASSDFYVRVYLAQRKDGDDDFLYPRDLVPESELVLENPAEAPVPLLPKNRPYLLGEQFGTNLKPNEARIFDFDWPKEWIPPGIVNGKQWRPCLLAEVSPRTGVEPSGNRLQDYPNLAMRILRIR